MTCQYDRQIYYTAAGRTIFIDACDDWSYQAISQVFAGWFLNPIHDKAEPQPDLTLRVRCGVPAPVVPVGLSRFEITNSGVCHTDNQSYYLKFDESLIVFGPGEANEVELWVDQPYDVSSRSVAQLISHALSPGLRRCGIFEIHSAAVIPPGDKQAILIAGPSGSGKSTLTSQLASCGWDYLSDDILLLLRDADEIRLNAFRRFFALTAETIAAVQLPQLTLKAGDLGVKARVTPEDHFQTSPVQQSTPHSIIFPGITSETQSKLVSLSPAGAMTRLLRLCPWASYDKPTSKEHLGVLGKLAHTVSAFDLLGGTDVLRAPKRVADMILDATH